jgi:predicted ester cyclase
MSLEENKAIARRHFEELWSKGDLGVADEIYSPAAIGHHSDQPDRTGYPEAEKQDIVRAREAFPDTVVTVEYQIAEGDMVLTRWRFEGTNTGPLHGLPSTGREASVTGFHVHRIIDGRIVEIWAQGDTLAFGRQLGLIPSSD